MNAKTILNTLAKSDIDLYLDESNQLKAKAPKGAITEEFRTLIKEHKASLVAYLEQLDAIYTKRDNNKKIEAAKRVDGKLIFLLPSNACGLLIISRVVRQNTICPWHLILKVS